MEDIYKFAISYTMCVGIYDENGTIVWESWRFSTQKEAMLVYKLWANTPGAKARPPYLESLMLFMPTAEERKELKRKGWKICEENFLDFSDAIEGQKALYAKRDRFEKTVRKLLYK